MNPYKVAWDMIMGVFYLIAISIDPYVFGFHFAPLENKTLNNLQRVLTLIFFFNILLMPMTGVRKEDVMLVDPMNAKEGEKKDKKKQKKKRGKVR